MRWTMPRMFSPTVIEGPIELEPVTADTFVTDLSRPSREATAILASAAASPHRRIYD
jgi:hypothetical protein